MTVGGVVVAFAALAALGLALGWDAPFRVPALEPLAAPSVPPAPPSAPTSPSPAPSPASSRSAEAGLPEPVLHLPHPGDPEQPVGVVWTAGRLITAAGGTLRTWKGAGGADVVGYECELETPRRAMRHMAGQVTGHHIVIADRHGVELHDPVTARKVDLVRLPDEHVGRLGALSPDEQRLAVLADGLVDIRRVGEEHGSGARVPGTPVAADYSPDGRTLAFATVNPDSLVYCSPLAPPGTDRTLLVPRAGARCTVLRYGRDGSLWVGDAAGGLRVIVPGTDERGFELRVAEGAETRAAHDGEVTGVAALDGVVYSASWDPVAGASQLRVWARRDGRWGVAPTVNRCPRYGELALDPTGAWLAAGTVGGVDVWDATALVGDARLRSAALRPAAVLAGRLLPGDGLSPELAWRDEQLLLLDGSTLREVRLRPAIMWADYPRVVGRRTALSSSRSGRLLLSGPDGWDALETRSVEGFARGEGDLLPDAGALSPDGLLVALGVDSPSFRGVTLLPLPPSTRKPSHVSGVGVPRRLVFSPDSTRLAMLLEKGARETLVAVWGLTDMEPALEVAPGDHTALEWSSDGNLWAGARDGRLRLLDCRSGVVLQELGQDGPAHEGAVTGIAAARQVVFSIGCDGDPTTGRSELARWDLASPRARGQTLSRGTGYARLASSPNGRWLAVGGRDRVEVWDVEALAGE